MRQLFLAHFSIPLPSLGGRVIDGKKPHLSGNEVLRRLAVWQVLSSLGQSSMLHLKGQRVSPERISRALQTLQVPFYLQCQPD